MTIGVHVDTCRQRHDVIGVNISDATGFEEEYYAHLTLTLTLTLALALTLTLTLALTLTLTITLTLT